VRIVCPYEPSIEFHCEAALPPETEKVHLGPYFDAYWRLLRELWADGESFILIEHDIVVTPLVIDRLTKCTSSPWCTHPYLGAGWKDGYPKALVQTSLGCVRFDQELILDHPEVWELVGEIDNANDSARREYHYLDVRLLGVLRDKLGYWPHIHGEPVVHHHMYQDGCSSGEGCSNEDHRPLY
jgi:hypothetical protein